MTIGMDDTVIVDAGDVLLVCKSDQAQKVREVVEHLQKTSPGKVPVGRSSDGSLLHEMQDPEGDQGSASASFNAKGSPVTVGVCPVCGTKLYRMGRTPAHEGLTAAAQATEGREAQRATCDRGIAGKGQDRGPVPGHAATR